MADRGDDLDDDFQPDGLVALSDDEAGVDVDLEDADTGADEDEDQDPAPNDRAAADKKRKRKEKMKEKKAKKRKLIETMGTESEDTSVAAASPYDLAQYLAGIQSKTFKDMSALELEDMRIPEDAIADTTVWTGPRTLDNLVDFIMKAVPALKTRLGQKSKSNGAPTMLFIAGAALRVADVTRVLKSTKLRGDKGGDVAKLFAKHFKLQDHVQYLKRTAVGAAVGTPGRVGKLLCETDALTISALSHIVLDITFRDAKKRNILDIPETRDEIFKTILGCPKVLKGIKEGKIQVVLF
ncbi:U3-containing 90S pre-ribosomal complex subunit-domain containing protein [Schizophyllum amplum]|uniref:U3-containing 90S pre-ribosomal complex subunit-domain containing protein n=1 Tax=Schizophyllum amplum TaxID=97359 RepID=A0A550CAB3_9AGAR|nr:U3-containing 90S pre-ribosomal complex subunit-domain containing protein [Auriculariopsis ampla]